MEALPPSALESMKATAMTCAVSLWESVGRPVAPPNHVCTFGTGEDFLLNIRFMPVPSVLLPTAKFVRFWSMKLDESDPNNPAQHISRVSLFREGVAPIYEDPANQNSGHIEVRVKPNHARDRLGDLDEAWYKLVCGAFFDPSLSNHLNGLCMADHMTGKGKITDHIRFEVWFSQEAQLAECVEWIKQCVGDLVTKDNAILYRSHKPSR
mmetsp:Transcript_14293/g.28895  ORF Transcript_14293/g.28895 Transcript_14293/m.28895 type:complete len:209 (+) Transcript_14293:86-712(+)